jgi:spore coat protein U-like protein
MRHSLALAALLSIPCLAHAGEVRGTFQVSLTVVASCSVQTSALNLGTYQSGGPATATQGSGGIDVRCTRGTPAQVFLDGTRTLTGPSGQQVSYALTADGKAWMR